MKLTRKLAALAMAVLLAVSLTACSPKEWAQNVVVHLVHKLAWSRNPTRRTPTPPRKPPQAAAWSSPPRWIPTPPVW